MISSSRTFPKITDVKAKGNLRLLVCFTDGARKVYNCSALIKEPPFSVLKNKSLFKSVKVDTGGYGISWNEDLDLSEAELWENGRDLEEPCAGKLPKRIAIITR